MNTKRKLRNVILAGGIFVAGISLGYACGGDDDAGQPVVPATTATTSTGTAGSGGAGGDDMSTSSTTTAGGGGEGGSSGGSAGSAGAGTGGGGAGGSAGGTDVCPASGSYDNSKLPLVDGGLPPL